MTDLEDRRIRRLLLSDPETGRWLTRQQQIRELERLHATRWCNARRRYCEMMRRANARPVDGPDREAEAFVLWHFVGFGALAVVIGIAWKVLA